MTELSGDEYVCYYCNFSCKKLSNWQDHLDTKKHIKCVENDIHISDLKTIETKCENCGKQYKTKSGLIYHQNKCKSNSAPVALPVEVVQSEPTDKELVMMLLKDNIEFKKMFTEFVINNQSNAITNNNTSHINSHNTNTINNTNNFNLQVFLNEKCKDALNINEFIDSIDISFADLENTANFGYVEGITDIIVKNLRQLDTYKRPIHCSDAKRGTLYFKHENKWEKDKEEKPIAKHVVRAVASKNIGRVTDWIKEHPGCQRSDSIKNNMYHKILNNAMSGDSQEIQSNNMDKVIRNIIKEVMIDKKMVC